MNLTEFQSKVQQLEATLVGHDVTIAFCEDSVLGESMVDWEVAKYVVISYLERRVAASEPRRFSWMDDRVWDSVKNASERNKLEAAKRLEALQPLTDEQWANLKIPGYAKCWEIVDAVYGQIG